jgi:hypothetical protein
MGKLLCFAAGEKCTRVWADWFLFLCRYSEILDYHNVTAGGAGVEAAGVQPSTEAPFEQQAQYVSNGH